jgi:hypothetical protein
MNFYILFLEVPDFSVPALDSLLMKFKKDLSKHGKATVIGVEESNYDFLYNSLIEKATSELKGR